MNKVILYVFFIISIGTLPTASSAFGQPEIVDLQLQQLVDVSASIGDDEFIAQRDAWAAAFSSTDVKEAIDDPNFNSICVQFIYWSGTGEQEIVLDWTIISDAASADAVKNIIQTSTKPAFAGGTAPHDAINFGVGEFENDVCEGLAKIIDVSGDGTGDEILTSQASDDAISNGIDAINGLAIGSDFLEGWYNTNIKRGPDSFILPINLDPITSAELTPKAEEKILMEIEQSKILNEIIIGGELIPIQTTTLLVTEVQTFSWMFPVVLSILGVGFFAVSRKTEKS